MYMQSPNIMTPSNKIHNINTPVLIFFTYVVHNGTISFILF